MAGAIAADTAKITGAAPSAEAATSMDQTADASPVFVSEPVVQPISEEQLAQDEAANERAARASSLPDLVAATPTGGELSRDMHCLAGAIYFESKGEPLEGQLAVGRVIVNRAESSRFPDSYCGVVLQRSQFSFVRGGRIPAINTGSAAWRKAKAIARIAHEGSFDSPAKGALFFHAKYVSPRWRLTRVATVQNHIFYR
jgi:spore germination cell wall hydrolase CwlJ-like protein